MADVTITSNSDNAVQLPGNNLPTQAEGSRGIRIPLDFTLGQALAFDMQQVYAQAKMKQLQTIFFDNPNDQVIYLDFGNSFQSLACPGNSQGYLRVLGVNPPRVTVRSQATTAGAYIVLMNYPVNNLVWSRTANFKFDGSGNLLVSDAALESALAGTALQVLDLGLGNSDAQKNKRIGDVGYAASIAAAATTADIIAAPGAATGWFFTEAHIYVSGNATISGGGTVQLQLKDGATVIAETDIYLANAVGGNAPPNYKVLELLNCNYNAQTANVALSMSLSGALTTGTVRANVLGGTTAIIA